jgi:hypothetical protein
MWVTPCVLLLLALLPVLLIIMGCGATGAVVCAGATAAVLWCYMVCGATGAAACIDHNHGAAGFRAHLCLAAAPRG